MGLVEDEPGEPRVWEKPQRTRPKGFTDDEAKAILTASLRDPETLGRMAEHNKQAVRWVPWICAYTGARVGEITQLRREDLIVEYGICCLRITPEAGTVKGGGYRTVPVHSHLIEQGLVEFIVSRPEGPIFFVPDADNDDPVKRASNAGKKVCKWVRKSAGVTDPRVQPNHGWRHRFKTLARDADMPHEYMNAIQGHAGGKAADDYGENTMKALYREIQKLPRNAL